MARTAADTVTGIRWKRTAGSLLLGGAALWIGGMALAMPETALQASLRGVSVWWEVLFPALFPFFVLSELLLGFGIVHLAGTLLDPFMRPLFRLPGIGAFVVAMGFASGYPVGARLTSRLMEQKLVSRDQGERLVEMTTTSDPIFLIGAVSVGFFGRADVVPLLALAHYGGALLLGVLGRFRGDRGELRLAEPDVPALGSAAAATRSAGGRLRAAIHAMHAARRQDGRPFGILLNQSIQSSLSLMMIVGGLVVFFSAALDLLLAGGMLVPLKAAAGWLLQLFGLPAALSPSFMQGLFEVTLGARAAAESVDAGGTLPLVHRLAAGAFVLSWAGLSVHAQVAGLMSRTGWRYGPFARTRLLHGFAAAAIVYAAWPLLGPREGAALRPVWLETAGNHPLQAAAWPFLTLAGTLILLVAAGAVVRMGRVWFGGRHG